MYQYVLPHTPTEQRVGAPVDAAVLPVHHHLQRCRSSTELACGKEMLRCMHALSYITNDIIETQALFTKALISRV